MNKIQFQNALLDDLINPSVDSIANIQRVEDELRKLYENDFLCYKMINQNETSYYLFFESDWLIEVKYSFKTSGGESLYARTVDFEEDIMRFTNIGVVLLEEDKEPSNKIVKEVAKNFLELIKGEKCMRLLEATGVIQMNEEIMHCDVF